MKKNEPPPGPWDEAAVKATLELKQRHEEHCLWLKKTFTNPFGMLMACIAATLEMKEEARRCGLPDVDGLEANLRRALVESGKVDGKEPISDEAPYENRVLCSVEWITSHGERGLMARCQGGPADLGISVVVMCQAIAAKPDLFGEPAAAAAAELIRTVTTGKVKLPPLEVYISERGSS